MRTGTAEEIVCVSRRASPAGQRGRGQRPAREPWMVLLLLMLYRPPFPRGSPCEDIDRRSRRLGLDAPPPTISHPPSPPPPTHTHSPHHPSSSTHSQNNRGAAKTLIARPARHDTVPSAPGARRSHSLPVADCSSRRPEAGLPPVVAGAQAAGRSGAAVAPVAPAPVP